MIIISFFGFIISLFFAMWGFVIIDTSNRSSNEDPGVLVIVKIIGTIIACKNGYLEIGDISGT